MIICCKIDFVLFIFMIYANHESIFTMKISRSVIHNDELHIDPGNYQVFQKFCSVDNVLKYVQEVGWHEHLSLYTLACS